MRSWLPVSTPAGILIWSLRSTVTCPSPRPAAPAGDHVAEAEEVAEDVAEVREDGGIEPARGAHAGVAVGVVALPLARIAQHAVRLGRLLELLLCLLVARVPIGVVL